MICPGMIKKTCIRYKTCTISDVFEHCHLFKCNETGILIVLKELPIEKRNGCCSICRKPNKRFIINNKVVCSTCAMGLLIKNKEMTNA